MNVTKYIPKGVTRLAGKHTLALKNQSPHIMFGVGVAGMVGTVVLASRATLQLETVLQSIDDKKFTIEQKALQHGDVVVQVDLDKIQAAVDHDKRVVTVQGALQLARLYAPAVVVGACSVALLTGSHVQLTNRNTALTAAYAAVDQAYRRYQQRVADEYGDEKARELRYDLETVKEKQTVDGKVETVKRKQVGPNGHSQYARFFDQMCKEWSPNPEYNLLFLRGHQNYLNDLLHMRGHLFLNEVYDQLGIDRTRAGAVVGWVISEDGDNYVDFGLYDATNERARDFVNGREGSILLDFNVNGPILGHMKED